MIVVQEINVLVCLTVVKQEIASSELMPAARKSYIDIPRYCAISLEFLPMTDFGSKGCILTRLEANSRILIVLQAKSDAVQKLSR